MPGYYIKSEDGEWRYIRTFCTTTNCYVSRELLVEGEPILFIGFSTTNARVPRFKSMELVRYVRCLVADYDRARLSIAEAYRQVFRVLKLGKFSSGSVEVGGFRYDNTERIPWGQEHHDQIIIRQAEAERLLARDLTKFNEWVFEGQCRLVVELFEQLAKLPNSNE